MSIKCKIVSLIIIILCLITGCSSNTTNKYPSEYEKSASPTLDEVLLPHSLGTNVIKDADQFVEIDTSNTQEGYVQVKLLKQSNEKIKFRIKKIDQETKYNYDLLEVGKNETFNFSQGSGAYQISLWKNISGDKYVNTLIQDIEVNLVNEQNPFLYPNQSVSYNKDTLAIQKGFELTLEDDTVLKRIETLYKFVVTEIAYDEEKAEKAKEMYMLPNIDQTLKDKKGICFDYASLLSAMLRSHHIPTRVIVGYTSKEYHSWVEVYLEKEGWVNPKILFEAEKWTLMDPTFAASKYDYKGYYDTVYIY